jgi:HD-GYP domain-containing protein (c-di-GMP phosphodiesterase class II)
MPGLREEIEASCSDWFATASDDIYEVRPGVWVVTSVINERRGVDQGLAVIPSNELLQEPSFDSMCEHAGIDSVWVRGRVESESPLAPKSGVSAMAGLIRQMHAGESTLLREHDVANSVDRRLSESYEEIHLLHSMISGLVVGTEPDPFLRSAAEQLGSVGEFEWVAVLVDETTEAFAPDHVVVGNGYPTRAELRRLVRTSGNPSSDAAIACDSSTLGEIVVCPIRIEQRTLGTLLAGGRSTGATSNVELKLVSAAAGHIGIFLANASLYADLDAMFLGTLQALVAAIDAKDPYTRGHSQRVALLSRDLAAALGMPEEFVKQIHLAGLVHDVGKIGVPEAVLCKAGKLTDEEMARIRQHPQIGYRILKDIPQIRELLPAVLCHHESWDGSGYPTGLSGEEIPLIARIVAVADGFDAMSSSRTYRAALPRDQVFAELERCAGTQFDPALVPTFLGLDLRAYDRHLLRDSVVDEKGGSTGLGLEAA